MVGRSKEVVWLEIFLRWGMDLASDDVGTERKKKTLWHAYHALDVFSGRHLDDLLTEFDVATFNGKPAIELGFRINIGNDFYYRGYVDVVLINKKTRELVVLEIKTTASKFVSAAKFQNSGQGLGYSLVCDYIAQQHPDVQGSHYKIFYLVFKTPVAEYEPFRFPKSHSARAMWIKQLLQECEHINGYDSDQLWPMYGESCTSWNRDCEFLGVCNLSDDMVLKGANPEVKEETFHFEISLMDLINAQLERSQEGILI